MKLPLVFLETDVQKRIMPGAGRPGGAPQK